MNGIQKLDGGMLDIGLTSPSYNIIRVYLVGTVILN